MQRYKINLINEREERFDLNTPEIGVWDNDWENFGIVMNETRNSIEGFSRVNKVNNDLSDDLTMRIIALNKTGMNPKARFEELDRFIIGSDDLFIERVDNGKTRKISVNFKSKQLTNINKSNALVQEYSFSKNTSWFSDIAFDSWSGNPNGYANGLLGIVFKANRNGIVFNIDNTSILFNNTYSGFNDTNFSYLDSSLNFSNSGTPFEVVIYNLNVVGNYAVIGFSKVGKTQSSFELKIPAVLLNKNYEIVFNTQPLKRGLYLRYEDGSTTKITPYIDDVTKDPFFRFDNGVKNSFSISNGIIRSIRALDFNEVQ